MTAPRVSLTESDPIPLAVIRRRALATELSVVVPRDCGLVWSFLEKQGVRGGRHVAVYLNAKIDVEVGVEMPGVFTEGGDVVRSQTPSGRVATTTHFGPYGQLGRAHDAIRAWCTAAGQRPAGPRWEIYGHWQDAWNTNASLIRTDVFYLLEPSA